MNISLIVVYIESHGTDTINLYTDLPSAFAPEVSRDNLVLSSECRAGWGVQYALDHFPGVPVEALNLQTGNRRRVR